MRRRLWSRVTGVLIAGLGLAAVPMAVGAPAQAVDACTTRTVSQPFTNWSDSNYYFPVTSGTFESGSSGWTIGSGVGSVNENEPWIVAGDGAHSLRIPAGSSVSTPEMCLTADEDSTRFFYKSPGSGAALGVTIKATNTISHSAASASFTITTGTFAGWQVSPPDRPAERPRCPGEGERRDHAHRARHGVVADRRRVRRSQQHSLSE
jgi:hypothetical protein